MQEEALCQKHTVKKSDVCLKHTFNGSIIGITDNRDYPYSFVIDTDTPVFLIVYRNSDTAGGSTCNISYKRITSTGEVLEETSGDIYKDDYKEDPRFFIVKNELYISYNQVYFYNNKISQVRVKYVKLSPDLAQSPEIVHSYSRLMPWEKNWMFFEHNSKIHFFYSLYPYRVIDENGTVIRSQEWLHPRDRERQIEQNTKFRITKDLNILRYARSSRELFYSERLTFDIRGGAAPVRVGDTYYLFAHVREGPNALYRLIVVLVDAITLMLKGFTYPLNVGVEDEETRIVYPAGAVYNIFNQTWYVSCGVNDKDLILVHIPDEFLSEKIIYFDESKHGITGNNF